MKWKDKLINDFIVSIEKDNNTEMIEILNLIRNQDRSIHLAILSEPFLSLILSGKKTMESRFSINNVVPYRKVLQKDIVLIKRVAGPIVGFFIAGTVSYFSNLTHEKIIALEKEFGNLLCWNVDNYFLANKSNTRYLTLVTVQKFFKINPIETTKSDRTGWSIVKLGLQNTLFENGSE